MFCSIVDWCCGTGASIRLANESGIPSTMQEGAWRELNLRLSGERVRMKLLAAEKRRTKEPP